MIYIYKKDILIDELNYSKEEFTKEWYPNWDETFKIYDKKFINPIFENGTLREATRDELVAKGIEVQLEAGEKIENKKLIKVEQPSKYHTWTGTEWVINLEEVKEKIRGHFKEEYKKHKHSNFEYEGNIFQMREADIPNFEKIKMALDILKKYENVEEILHLLQYLDSNLVLAVRKQMEVNPSLTKTDIVKMLENYRIDWRLIDNTTASLTYSKVLDILLAWIFRDGGYNNIYNKINEQILQASTIEELELIKWG